MWHVQKNCKCNWNLAVLLLLESRNIAVKKLVFPRKRKIIKNCVRPRSRNVRRRVGTSLIQPCCCCCCCEVVVMATLAPPPPADTLNFPCSVPARPPAHSVRKLVVHGPSMSDGTRRPGQMVSASIVRDCARRHHWGVSGVCPFVCTSGASKQVLTGAAIYTDGFFPWMQKDCSKLRASVDFDLMTDALGRCTRCGLLCTVVEDLPGEQLVGGKTLACKRGR